MNIAIVGCGFVFDIYMRTLKAHPELNVAGVYDLNPERARRVGKHYGFQVYESFESLLRDQRVSIVVNLTNIGSHYAVIKQALEAGKHVYSEKPLTKSVEESATLFQIAAERGVRLYAAPCNIFSDTVRTLFKAVEDKAIGKPLLVYAELDDNPIHLMEFEKVRSPTGAPWPLEEEIREGCTYEHIGYHLVWICGLLGPATHVTAMSSELIDNKKAGMPAKVGTPDYSVACLTFANGAAARITCSVVAPRDHRMRIIGHEGEVYADSYRHYKSPVYLERFTKGGLSARKLRTLRTWPGIGSLFGIGGKRLPFVRHWKSVAMERNFNPNSTVREKLFEWVRRREVYAQDKLIGVVEMAQDLKLGREQYLSPDFIMHVNELTLLVQGAGPEGVAIRPTTTFSPIGSIPGSLPSEENFRASYRSRFLEKLITR